MSLTLYQASVRRTESKAVEWAQRTLSQTIVLGLLYSNDPVRGPRLARWEEIARLRLRQLRGLPKSAARITWRAPTPIAKNGLGSRRMMRRG
jgi:hypothetical protein